MHLFVEKALPDRPRKENLLSGLYLLYLSISCLLKRGGEVANLLGDEISYQQCLVSQPCSTLIAYKLPVIVSGSEFQLLSSQGHAAYLVERLGFFQ